jgi:arylsulfatase A-like enzyme/Flp pilus assembly protein TadD
VTSTPALLALSAILVLCGTACDRAPSAPSRPNLLLITLDTTRADHLGCYGSKTAETPRLDRLAKEGLLVEHAIGVAPVTLPSHASILTGLYPPRHGVRDNADFRLPDSETTLAEHLRAHGYATEAVVGSIVLSGALGVQQGFEGYDEPRASAMGTGGAAAPVTRIVERSAAGVTDAAIGALDRVGTRPFFLWAHYYDPHQAYAPPEPYAQRFSGRLYDGEIAYMDAQIGRLLDDLERRDLLDRTLVVVTADHGESLGDHGEETHGIFVYDAAIRVPLLLRLPGAILEGRKATRLVSGVDLVPTALDLLGLPPLAGVHGTSFAAAARGGAETPREPAYAEAIYPERMYGWSPTYSLQDAATKFIEAPEPELYDLRTDPGELRNLAAERPEDVAQWRGRMEAAIGGFGKADPSAESPMDAEARERLASLGYLSGGSGKVVRKTRPDPKRLVAVNQKFVRATTLISEGRHPEALKLLDEVIEADPENPAALSLGGTLSFWSGKREHGLAQLEAAARSAPGVFDNQWNLANALHVSGKLAEAASVYRAALAVQPHSAEAHYGLAQVHVAQGDGPGAVKEYNEAIRLGLATPAVRAALAAALAATGDAAGAEAGLRAAVQADPSLTEAWNKLGVLAARAGRREEARDHYAKAMVADPDNAEALFNHARLSMVLGDRAAAVRDVDRLAAKHPEYPATRYLRAHLLAQDGDAEGARRVLKDLLARPQGADPKLIESAKEMLAKLGG